MAIFGDVTLRGLPKNSSGGGSVTHTGRIMYNGRLFVIREAQTKQLIAERASPTGQ
jgi:hypothetical protein